MSGAVLSAVRLTRTENVSFAVGPETIDSRAHGQKLDSLLDMRPRTGQIAVAAVVSVGMLTLTSCVTNTDVPTTFTAALTVRGEADQASAESGECTIGGIRVAPNDQINLFGDNGAGSTRSILETNTIDQKPDGTGTCTYTAIFDAIPANQRSYDVYLNNGFARETFTSDELRHDPTYVLHRN